MDTVMTGRALAVLLINNVANLGLPVVTEEGEEVIAITERVWGPDEMVMAGTHMKGQIVLKTRRRDGNDS